MVRVIVGVIAGFVVWSVLWLVTNQVVQAAAPGAVQEDGSIAGGGVLVAILGASAVCSLVSGLLAALIAPAGRFRAAVALGVLLLAVGVMVQVQYWSVMPLWYHLSFLALLLPVTVVGAALRRGQSRAVPSPS